LDLRLPALSSFFGQRPAHEIGLPAEAKRSISTPISDTITSAASEPTPGVAGALPYKLLAGTQQIAHLLRRLIGHEAATDQTMSHQIGKPCSILDVGFTAGNVLDMRGITKTKLRSWRNSRCSKAPGPTKKRAAAHQKTTDLCASDTPRL
jgi:hypothetical protein